MRKCVIISLAVIIALSLFWATGSYAKPPPIISQTLTLTRSAPGLFAFQEYLDDGTRVGAWQHEGGSVYYANVKIANYAIYRRVTLPESSTGGTGPQNTGMVTMTIFFLDEVVFDDPPGNITLQGSHDFSSGKFIGSVSAASDKYSDLIGGDFSGAPIPGSPNSSVSLTITWKGNDLLP